LENAHIIFGLLNILSGALFILIAYPPATGKVSFDGLYGMLVPESMVSDEKRFKLLRYGSKQLLQWSIFLVLIGVLYFIFPINWMSEKLLNTAIAIGPIFICPAATIGKTILYYKEEL